MTNLTISLEPEIVKAARLRAIEEGTSVSAQVREYLTRYAQRKITLSPSDAGSKAGDLFLSVAMDSESKTIKKWTRDELHDRHVR